MFPGKGLALLFKPVERGIPEKELRILSFARWLEISFIL
jgi:hypothetical protein